MSFGVSVQNIYGYVFVGLLWLVLVVASGSLPWAIIGGIGASSLTFAVSRQWTNALIVGAIVATIISVFGIVAMLSPAWYRSLV